MTARISTTTVADRLRQLDKAQELAAENVCVAEMRLKSAHAMEQRAAQAHYSAILGQKLKAWRLGRFLMLCHGKTTRAKAEVTASRSRLATARRDWTCWYTGLQGVPLAVVIKAVEVPETRGQLFERVHSGMGEDGE